MANTLKPRLRVRDLDLPERRKRPTSSREEGVDAQTRPFGKAIESIESRSHILGECEMYKEERDVLQELRKIDEYDMGMLGTATYYGGPSLIGPMVYTKTYKLTYVYSLCLVLSTMVPRNR